MAPKFCSTQELVTMEASQKLILKWKWIQSIFFQLRTKYDARAVKYKPRLTNNNNILMNEFM